MWLFKNEKCVSFLVEKEAYDGVKRIAKKVAEDMYLVSDKRPEIYQEIQRCGNAAILFATLGKSKLLDQLQEYGVMDAQLVIGKREVYGVRLFEGAVDEKEEWKQIPDLNGIEQLLVIYGSDKRGTIYGMFHISEILGVSPLYFWGDALPEKKKELQVNASIERISKEPSVRYRGFFINDEWPCFGSWAFHHYGGFTVEMYDKVFELLLRLKGNYLWPAMWTSSFALDGPGEASAELADSYGIIIGNSHHEPCLRAGEEWDIYRGEDSIYGNEWNYAVNKEGLLRYWKDGLRRSGKYESIVTIGMRGERDSTMPGAQGLQENIDMLKEIITYQKKMIAETVTNQKPRMLLAIYKEVEEYFYGNSKVQGLKEWNGLEDVILMFCEDNFGHMRYLPTREEYHPGGYGMYYHLDYHGAPISYEWINTTPLTTIWEQMTLAYRHGIKEVWMINAGDIKGNEFPLSYFMDLAYDYETWGTVNQTEKYTKKWLGIQFGNALPELQKTWLADILTKGILMFARRRPEALDSNTYHPYHEMEADRVLEEIRQLEKQLKQIKNGLQKESENAFCSMIYDDLRMGLNLITMQIYAGKNQHYAQQGKVIANFYKKSVHRCIKKDRALIEQATKRNQGKWFGMKTGSHIGFQKWNEDGCRYPLLMQVEPFFRPRMLVSRADDKKILQKNYGTHETMEIYDFMYPVERPVVIEIANDGIGCFNIEVQKNSCDWLVVDLPKAEIEYQELLYLHCNPKALPAEEEICEVRIFSEDTMVQLNVHGRRTDVEKYPPKTFFSKNNIFSMLAEHFVQAIYVSEISSIATERTAPYDEVVLKQFGLCGSGVTFWKNKKEKIEGLRLTYAVAAETEGEYQMELWSAPSNLLTPGAQVVYRIRNAAKTKEWKTVEIFPPKYQAGEAACEFWAKGVIEQVHKNKTNIFLKKGWNLIEIAWFEENVVLEKIILYPQNVQLKTSCMGPEETYFWNCE